MRYLLAVVALVALLVAGTAYARRFEAKPFGASNAMKPRSAAAPAFGTDDGGSTPAGTLTLPFVLPGTL